jgi:hypothetical protein
MLLDWSIALDANNPLSKKGYLQKYAFELSQSPFLQIAFRRYNFTIIRAG